MVNYQQAAKALINHISGEKELNPAERKILAAILQDWPNIKPAIEAQLPALKAALATRIKLFETREKALSKREARNLRTLAL